MNTGDFECELSENVGGLPVDRTVETELASHLIYEGIAFHFYEPRLFKKAIWKALR